MKLASCYTQRLSWWHVWYGYIEGFQWCNGMINHCLWLIILPPLPAWGPLNSEISFMTLELKQRQTSHSITAYYTNILKRSAGSRCLWRTVSSCTFIPPSGGLFFFFFGKWKWEDCHVTKWKEKRKIYAREKINPRHRLWRNRVLYTQVHPQLVSTYRCADATDFASLCSPAKWGKTTAPFKTDTPRHCTIRSLLTLTDSQVECFGTT